MKRFILLTFLVLVVSVTNNFAQERGFSYQGLAFNDDRPIIDQEIKIKISLLKGSETGESVYSEKHAVITNNFGFFVLTIGDGEIVQGSFEDIDWSVGQVYIKTELAITGDVFTEMGTSKLLSVPFAYYAEKTPVQTLILEDDTLTLSNGNKVSLEKYKDLYDLRYSQDSLIFNDSTYVALTNHAIVNSGVKLGYTQICSAANAGMMRYNTKAKKMQYCDGLKWLVITATETIALSIEDAKNDNLSASAPNGSIHITPAGGLPPYIYKWSTGETSSSISGLMGGTYKVTVQDANDDSIEKTFSIVDLFETQIAKYTFDLNIENSIAGSPNLNAYTSITYTSDRKNVSNKALALTVGTDIKTNYPLTLDNFSVSFWVKSSHFYHWYPGAFTTTGNSFFGHFLGSTVYTLDQKGKFQTLVKDVNGVGHAIFSNTQVTLQEWHHIVITYSSETKDFKLYIDNVLEGEKNIPEPVSILGSDLHIGKVIPASEAATDHVYLTGAIDEFVIYNKELSTSEIAELFNE